MRILQGWLKRLKEKLLAEKGKKVQIKLLERRNFLQTKVSDNIIDSNNT